MLNPNILGTRSYIEMQFSNMIGLVQRMYRNNLPESIDYIIGYWMGILKNEVFSPSQSLQANSYIDYLNFIRYQWRHMNCDEIMNIIWPQLFQVNDESLSSQSLPPLITVFDAVQSPLWNWKNLGLWKNFRQIFFVKNYAFELYVN